MVCSILLSLRRRHARGTDLEIADSPVWDPAVRDPPDSRSTRPWARTSVPPLHDPLGPSAGLTHFPDIASGTSAFDSSADRTGTSLDHAVCFHRPLRMDDWVLMDPVPDTMAGARGWYTRTVQDTAGRLGASLTQEILARPRTPPGRTDRAS
ncbi:MAG: acyl-CoA thioesterase [Blastococcus sp.]|nr:acyl-CoA thioesterase [Blastococcus sp.]